MEHQLAELTAQLQAMQVQNTELSGLNDTLEKAVVFKDHEVADLQERNNVRSVHKCHCHPCYSACC